MGERNKVDIQNKLTGSKNKLLMIDRNDCCFT